MPTIFFGVFIAARDIIFDMSTLESTILAMPAKEQVRILLDQLPDNCSIEDVQYGIYVIEKVRRGREAIDRGEGVSQEEVERQVKQWLTR